MAYMISAAKQKVLWDDGFMLWLMDEWDKDPMLLSQEITDEESEASWSGMNEDSSEDWFLKLTGAEKTNQLKSCYLVSRMNAKGLAESSQCRS